MNEAKIYYINHNGNIYGRWTKEEEAKNFGKVLTQDEWDENKVVEVTRHG
ncbi:MAG: hypothetical protein V3U54_07880 [Thermodesulfobacteriota bacterium]